MRTRTCSNFRSKRRKARSTKTTSLRSNSLNTGRWSSSISPNTIHLSPYPSAMMNAYRLAPMEPCSKETYERLMQRMEHIDYSKIVTYKKKDETEQKKELACAGGVCEIV